MMCRKSYQRGKYAADKAVKSHCKFYQDALGHQLLRIKLWRPDCTFKVQLQAAAKKRLEAYHAALRRNGGNQAAAEQAVAVSEGTNKKGKVVPLTLPNAVKMHHAEHIDAHFTGDSKSVSFLINDLLPWISRQIESNDMVRMPPVEFLINDPVPGETINDPANNFEQWCNALDNDGADPEPASSTPASSSPPKIPKLKLNGPRPVPSPTEAPEETTTSSPPKIPKLKLNGPRPVASSAQPSTTSSSKKRKLILHGPRTPDPEGNGTIVNNSEATSSQTPSKRRKITINDLLNEPSTSSGSSSSSSKRPKLILHGPRSPSSAFKVFDTATPDATPSKKRKHVNDSPEGNASNQSSDNAEAISSTAPAKRRKLIIKPPRGPAPSTPAAQQTKASTPDTDRTPTPTPEQLEQKRKQLPMYVPPAPITPQQQTPAITPLPCIIEAARQLFATPTFIAPVQAQSKDNQGLSLFQPPAPIQRPQKSLSESALMTPPILARGMTFAGSKPINKADRETGYASDD